MSIDGPSWLRTALTGPLRLLLLAAACTQETAPDRPAGTEGSTWSGTTWSGETSGGPDPKGGLILFSGPFDGSVSVLAASAGTRLAGETYTGGVVQAAGDTDGDGAHELLVGASAGFLLLDGASLEPSNEPTIVARTSTAWFARAAGDADGDGLADLLVLSQPFNELHLGPFPEEIRSAQAVGAVALSVRATQGMYPYIDLDADGSIEFVQPMPRGGIVLVPGSAVPGWFEVPDPAWAVMPYVVEDGQEVEVVVLPDLDGGGAPEIALRSADPLGTSVSLDVVLGEGWATGSTTTVLSLQAAQLWIAVLDDVDGDGIADVALVTIDYDAGCWHPAIWRVVSGAGAADGREDWLVSGVIAGVGDVELAPDDCTADLPWQIVAGDLDQDGRRDLVFGGTDPAWILAAELGAETPVHRLEAETDEWGPLAPAVVEGVDGPIVAFGAGDWQ